MLIRNIKIWLFILLSLAGNGAVQAANFCNGVHQNKGIARQDIYQREQQYLRELPKKKIFSYQRDFAPAGGTMKDLFTDDGDLYLFRSFGSQSGPREYQKTFQGQFHGQDGGVSYSLSPFIGNIWGNGKGYVAIARQNRRQNLVHHGFTDGQDQYRPYTAEWYALGGRYRPGMSYLLPLDSKVRFGQMTPDLYEVRVPDDVENVIGWIAVEDLNRITRSLQGSAFSMDELLSRIFQSPDFQIVERYQHSSRSGDMF